MRQKKKRQTDRSRNRRTHEVPFIVACSHFTRKNTRFRAPASSPKHSPCNIMQTLQCGSQHNNTRAADDKSHAAIPMRSATGDSKTPYNYAHTTTPKAASSHRYTAEKKNDKPTAAATVAHTRYLSSSPAATLHGKTQGFVLRLPPQNIAHATSCSHSNAICNHSFKKRIELRRQKHTQSSFKAQLHCGKKKTTHRPQPQPPHRRGTFHRRLQPLYTEKHKVSCSGFLSTTLPMQHSCSHSNAICNHSFTQ